MESGMGTTDACGLDKAFDSKFRKGTTPDNWSKPEGAMTKTLWVQQTWWKCLSEYKCV